jgi:hypothetical protein
MNPALNGIHAVANVIMNGGQFHGTDGIFENAPTMFPVKGATGSTVWQYWVIAKSATYGDTAPMTFGMVKNGTASWSGLSASLTFPTFTPTLGDTITCSILRTTGSSTAPYPKDGVADVVATGQACSAGTYWTYTDKVPTASLTTYRFVPTSVNGFFPTIQNWSGEVILSGRAVNVNSAEGSYAGACWPGTSFVTTRNYGGRAYPQVTCQGASYSWLGSSGSNGYNPVARAQMDAYGINMASALVMQNRYGPLTPATAKGVLNLGSTSGNADILTLIDSNQWKTLATEQNRPTADTGDAAIGADGSGHMAFRSPDSISYYIDHTFDGSSYLERLTSKAKTFTVPVAAPSYRPEVIYSASPGPALPICASALKGAQAVVSDAASPTYLGPYTSGGNITAAVICSFNGARYAWVTH